jgi:hypothetical protein
MALNSLSSTANGASSVLVSTLRSSAIVLPLSQVLDVSDGGLGNALWDLAGARPSLDLDFATTKSLADLISGQNLITFGRAGGTATYVGATRTIVTAAANEPRFTHDPVTGESLGLLLEEQRTNYIRNNTMVGAAAGTPGTLPTNWNINAIAVGLSRTVVGTGVEGGINYIDLRINGTTSDANAFQLSLEGSTTTAAVNGQAWANSFYCKVVAGTLANITTAVNAVNMFSATPTNLAAIDLDFTPASSATPLGSARIVNPVTLNQASTASVQPRIRLTIPSGVAVDVTLRIGLPQLEQGAFATSVIPTSGIAATRNADVVSITGANFSSWYRQDEGTLYAQTTGVPASVTIYNLHDGTTGNRIIAGYASDVNISWRVVASSSDQWNFTAGNAIATRNTLRHVLSYKTNDFTGCANGGALQIDSLGAVPTVNALSIGQNLANVGQLNAPMARLVFWPKALPTKLQTITA